MPLLILPLSEKLLTTSPLIGHRQVIVEFWATATGRGLTTGGRAAFCCFAVDSADGNGSGVRVSRIF